MIHFYSWHKERTQGGYVVRKLRSVAELRHTMLCWPSSDKVDHEGESGSFLAFIWMHRECRYANRCKTWE